MIDERALHLYAVARTVIPIGQLLRVLADPVRGSDGRETLYTLEVTGSRGDKRFFGVHSSTLRQVDDKRLAVEIAGAYFG